MKRDLALTAVAHLEDRMKRCGWKSDALLLIASVQTLMGEVERLSPTGAAVPDAEALNAANETLSEELASLNEKLREVNEELRRCAQDLPLKHKQYEAREISDAVLREMQSLREAKDARFRELNALRVDVAKAATGITTVANSDAELVDLVASQRAEYLDARQKVIDTEAAADAAFVTCDRIAVLLGLNPDTVSCEELIAAVVNRLSVPTVTADGTEKKAGAVSEPVEPPAPVEPKELGMQPEQAIQAIRSYVEGSWAISQIAKELTVSEEAVRAYLTPERTDAFEKLRSPGDRRAWCEAELKRLKGEAAPKRGGKARGR
jgi:hypothetical protein